MSRIKKITTTQKKENMTSYDIFSDSSQWNDYQENLVDDDREYDEDPCPEMDDSYDKEYR